MKRIVLLTAMALFATTQTFAEGLTGQALLTYEGYDSGPRQTEGFRQTYDVRFEKAISDVIGMRLLFRADDFQGSTDYLSGHLDSHTQQLQPTAELDLNEGNVHGMLRSETIDLTSALGNVESTRTTRRSIGELTWSPESLPEFHANGERNAVRDPLLRTDITDDYATVGFQYAWRDILLRYDERYANSVSPLAGYELEGRTHDGEFQYGTSRLNGRLIVSAQGIARLTHQTQTALEGGTGSIPIPVVIPRALYSLDDTPEDGRDRPIAPYPSLIDGNINKSTGISLGPDGSSFNNLVIDLGRLDRVDEIRIIVRDSLGNPLRQGGGTVTWDVYTSRDGEIWTRFPTATTTFDLALSLYSVTSSPIVSRWIKVVNFGVNSRETYVTELQAYYHVTLAPGTNRTGDQNNITGLFATTIEPVKRLTLSYAGSYVSFKQTYGSLPSSTSTDIEHSGLLGYDIGRGFSIREQYLKRTVEGFANAAETDDGLTTFLDYSPSRQLRVSFEHGVEKHTLGPTRFTIDTDALHTSAQILESMVVNFDVGIQTQAYEGAVIPDSARHYANLTGDMQVSKSLRLLLVGSIQKTDSQGGDPAGQFLGPELDNRVTGELTWRPGQQLTLSTRLGYIERPDVSAVTHRYFVEWHPFGRGTMSIGASYDEDVDPSVGRRATRTIVNPRWLMNEHASFDINYTLLTTDYGSTSSRNQTLFATLTLTK